MVGQEEVGGFTQRVKRAWSCLGDKEGVGVYFKEAYQGVTTVVQTALMPTFDYNITITSNQGRVWCDLSLQVYIQQEAPKGVIHLKEIVKVFQSTKRREHLIKNIFMLETRNRTSIQDLVKYH